MSRVDNIRNAKVWIDSELMDENLECASTTGNACTLSIDSSTQDWRNTSESVAHSSFETLSTNDDFSLSNIQDKKLIADENHTKKRKSDDNQQTFQVKAIIRSGTSTLYSCNKSSHDSLLQEANSSEDSFQDDDKGSVFKTLDSYFDDDEDKCEQQVQSPLTTGLVMSRRMAYRISCTSLSPHISPVSQSQVRLLFTPNTSF